MYSLPNFSFTSVKHHEPIGDWAERHIVMPRGGPLEGYYFNRRTQPITRLWFDALEDPRFNRRVAVAPTQSGKTVIGSSIPAMYHLFHLSEDVIYGVPTIDMAADKWSRDLLPMIEASEFADLLPTKGRGARGGNVKSITFRNGARLQFMGAGGGDKARAGYTSRVLVMTEVDGYDEAGGSSREADKVTQMEARLLAYGSRKSVYMECTASVAEGRIWQEYLGGTAAVVEIKCPLCGEYVAPEREHFKGWQEAESEAAARRDGCFHCPACDAPWTEEARIDAVRACRMVHKNESSTFSFRWSAVHNLFVPQSDIAFSEWKSAKRPDRDNAEKQMSQFIWAMPYEQKPPDDYLSIESLERSQVSLRRGIVPDWATILVVGADVHKHIIYWVVTAWRDDATGHIVDYGTTDCMSNDHGEERGIEIGLDTMHEFMANGFHRQNGEIMHATLGCVDCGYRQDVVVNWCRRVKKYYPSQGQGQSLRRFGAPARRYSVLKNSLEIGEQWHVVRVPSGNVILQHNVDFGKTSIHHKMRLPHDTPGALTLFNVPSANDHLKFLKHIASEQLLEERGEVRWVQESRNNHYLDAIVLSWTAARKAGVRLIAEENRCAPSKPTTVLQLKEALSRIGY